MVKLLRLLLLSELCALWCVVGHGAMTDALFARAFLRDTLHDVQVDGDSRLTSRGGTNEHATVERWERRRQGKVVRHTWCAKMTRVGRTPARSCELTNTNQPATVNVRWVHVLRRARRVGGLRVAR